MPDIRPNPSFNCNSHRVPGMFVLIYLFVNGSSFFFFDERVMDYLPLAIYFSTKFWMYYTWLQACLMNRVADPDPGGSGFFSAPGSGSVKNILGRIRIRENISRIRNSGINYNSSLLQKRFIH